jgi:anaerobic magnesium-protoporphyrin IX monomethyl ester cyclase
VSLSVLFTHSYFLRLDPKQLAAAKPYPPLGTLYAMAWLREQGHEVALHDTMFAEGPEGFEAALDEHRPALVAMYDDGFNWLTKMCLANMQRAAFDMIAAAKRRGLPVVVCSSDSSDHRRRYLEAGADAVILGEGEITLGEVAAAVKIGEPWDGTAGMALLREGEVVLTGPRRNIREPDTLPRAAWDLVDLEPYETMWRRNHGHWSLNMVTSRGCPYRCTWCAKPIYGNQYFLHSPERIVDDLAWLAERHTFEHIWFCDDIFGLRADWLEAFADGLEARGLSIRFMIQARVDMLVKDRIREAMVRAGLETVWLGVESGSQKILDAMDKGITVEQVHQAVPPLQAAGVKVAFFLQFGYLGETREDIRKTLDMVLELLPDEIGISVSYPLPGTPFFETVRAQMGEKTNWDHSDDLALMYEGTFPPAYYRRLHRWVHKRFQAARGLASWKRLVSRPRSMERRHWRSALLAPYFVLAGAVDGIRLARLERA